MGKKSDQDDNSVKKCSRTGGLDRVQTLGRCRPASLRGACSGRGSGRRESRELQSPPPSLPMKRSRSRRRRCRRRHRRLPVLMIGARLQPKTTVWKAERGCQTSGEGWEREERGCVRVCVCVCMPRRGIGHHGAELSCSRDYLFARRQLSPLSHQLGFSSLKSDHLCVLSLFTFPSSLCIFQIKTCFREEGCVGERRGDHPFATLLGRWS